MPDIESINQNIINCRKCPRLIGWIEEVATNKVKRHREEVYWGKPVPGFGDPSARVLILGLAPAAHGANRTGRMFTGDSSGDWLYKALYETGFANQPTSEHAHDGLQLKDVYIMASAHCAPPQNKPTKEEITNCAPHLRETIAALSNLQVVLCLGKIAFDHYIKLHDLKGLVFGHNSIHKLQNGKVLISSYHPSRQNTQTGRLLWEDWKKVFEDITNLLS